jgi:hypothetical protein
MTIIAFAPRYNTGAKKDATGAFIPEAKAFLRFHSQPATNLALIDNERPPGVMRAFVRRELSRYAGLTGVAFFCHGFRTGIQFGFRSADAPTLVSSIVDPSPDLRLTLYACDAARDADKDRDDDRADEIGGDGGFADALRDALASVAPACAIDAHTTAAHTTRNPDVRRFQGPAGAGGAYIIPRGDPLWPAWRDALRGDLRFAFPFLTVAEIRARLA